MYPEFFTPVVNFIDPTVLSEPGVGYITYTFDDNI